MTSWSSVRPSTPTIGCPASSEERATEDVEGHKPRFGGQDNEAVDEATAALASNSGLRWPGSGQKVSDGS